MTGHGHRPVTEGICQVAGKMKYSRHDAELLARKQRRRDHGADPQSAYACRACGRWHVGHRAPGRRRARRRRST